MSAVKTFKQFKSAFIRVAARTAIEYAAVRGEIIVPENYVAEFWTADHVNRLSDALRRARSGPSVAVVKDYLELGWEQFKLRDMTRKELAEHINGVFKTRLKPATVRQLAYRMGLFSTTETKARSSR